MQAIKSVQPKKAGWKKMWKQRWWSRNGCDGIKVMQHLINTILCVLLQVSLGLSTKFTWIVDIKIFVNDLPSKPFLGCHLWFHIFFTLAFWGCTVWQFLFRYIPLLLAIAYYIMHQSRPSIVAYFKWCRKL